MIAEYLAAVWAPWRRVNRTEFNLALLLLSLPGLLLSVFGGMDSAAGLFGTLGNLSNAMQGGGGVGDLEAMHRMVSSLNSTVAGAAAPAATAVAAPLNIGALLGNVLLFLALPFVRGRLLDIGYGSRTAMVGALLIQLSVLDGVLAVFGGKGLLPLGWVFGLLTFVSYFYLSLKAAAPRTRRRIGADGVARIVGDDDDYPRI